LFEDPFEAAQDAQMQKPPLDPDVDDAAPTGAALTVYDEQHIITYLRLLDYGARSMASRPVRHSTLCRPSGVNDWRWLSAHSMREWAAIVTA
jgi:hypothetical protein